MNLIKPSFNVCEDILEYFHNYHTEDKIDEEKILTAIGKTPSYVKKSLAFLTQIGILELSDGSYSFINKYSEFLNNGGNEVSTIKLAITNNEVFKEYVKIINKGKTAKQSAKYVIALQKLNIDSTDLINVMAVWAKYLEKVNKNNSSKSIDKEKMGFMWVDENGNLMYDEKKHSEVILDELKKEKKSLGEGLVFVDPKRIEDLEKIRNTHFDLTKLIKKCEELNIAYSTACYFSVGMLTRAIIDHIPPIFGRNSFNEVAGGYGSKSFKDSMMHLNKSSRKIADSFLHTHIRRKETLPTKTQVNFSSDLDVLLGEVIRILN